jgi:aromatic-L-amino-acid decarboxylase
MADHKQPPSKDPDSPARQGRDAPLAMTGEEFRRVGHDLVDRIAGFLDGLPQRPVTPGESVEQVRTHLGQGTLPAQGTPADTLLTEATGLLFDHSLFNGHPRFMAYITSSAAPIGALGDLLAATINANGGGWNLSPMASEIEGQAVRWIGELVGFPTGGGLMVSGGNMANFIGFLAARRACADWDLRTAGMGAAPAQPLVYTSADTHTWIQKATDLFGLGTDAIRWVATDDQRRMQPDLLQEMIATDLQEGHLPFCVVGTAGSVGTGAVDPLPEIAAICRRHDLWFHVDGAYGALAAALPEASRDLKGLSQADSLALDPHKWLYTPIEAGCTLVRDRQHLVDAFSYIPSYYNFSADEPEPPTNYYELGMQNSRGFRALKVWLGLRHAGRDGITRMIRDDIQVAGDLHELVTAADELEPHSHNLSITTYRFVPSDLTGRDEADAYLNDLNQELLNRMQAGGEAFISNAVIDDRYLLRACVVNFRTTRADMEALVEITTRLGREVDSEMRPAELRS